MGFLSLSNHWVRFLLHLWPPFWFTGISFSTISPDFRHICVRMSLRFYNKNVIGIHYGGNLFSMTDPCYMMMLMRNLGRGYRIIDQAAEIEFVKPGRGVVTAHCYLQQSDVDDITEKTQTGDKYLKHFVTEVTDNNNEVIAKIKRVVYIRKINH